MQTPPLPDAVRSADDSADVITRELAEQEALLEAIGQQYRHQRVAEPLRGVIEYSATPAGVEALRESSGICYDGRGFDEEG